MNLRNFKRYSLAVSIMIVLALFVNVAINTFYDEPENPCYNNFNERAPSRFCDVLDDAEERQNCLDENNKLNEDSKKCFDDFRPVQQLYNRNVFIILTIVGLATILGGLYLGSTPVASGLILAGILNLIIGVMRYWSDMQDFLRLIVLGIALAVLIYLGYKKIT